MRLRNYNFSHNATNKCNQIKSWYSLQLIFDVPKVCQVNIEEEEEEDRQGVPFQQGAASFDTRLVEPYIVVGGNSLKFCSTQILASLQTKVPAHPTSTRHCWRPEMLSFLGLSHVF